MTRDERRELITRYGEGVRAVEQSLDGFPADKLTERPFAGKWTAAEIVHHLADSETASALRLRRLLVEDKPVIQGYDQESFATRLWYQDRPIAPALDLFRAARATTVQLLERIADTDWSREGWHTEAGRYTPEIWLAIYADHAHNHAAQIARLKEAVRA